MSLLGTLLTWLLLGTRGPFPIHPAAIILALGGALLIAFSKIIRAAASLREENDLTI